MATFALMGVFVADRKILYEGKFKRLVIENGWEYVERMNCLDVVAILAVTQNDELVLVEQLRIPVGKNVVELPAGLVDDKPHLNGETLEDAARRELLEETGYSAKKLIPMMVMPASPALCREMITVFRAGGLEKVGSGGGDHLESIIPHAVKLDKIDVWLEKKKAEGGLIDPKVYTALYFLEKERRACRNNGGNT
ncbi:MAG: NUDIX hydrolase [Candidatus Omnitrophica bacterium]|nr:NUDIX hydrolase [Candidatus Omnitrophota bacterium]